MPLACASISPTYNGTRGVFGRQRPAADKPYSADDRRCYSIGNPELADSIVVSGLYRSRCRPQGVGLAATVFRLRWHTAIFLLQYEPHGFNRDSTHSFG